MGDEIISRRDFIRIMGSVSLLFSLPITSGCIISEPYVVSLVRHTDAAYAIKQALELSGGIDFVGPGDTVLLKLALNSKNPFPATTSPSMVSEIINLLKDKGAGEIYVGDKSPMWHDKSGGTIGCMQETGIYQAVVDAGAEVVEFKAEDMVPVNPGLAIHWPDGFSMPEIFHRVDHIIALPTLRTHLLAGFTMGLKIFVGAIPQEQRSFLHQPPYFLEKIAEIALCTNKIRLSVLDARQGFSADGPDNGTLIAPGIIIASKTLPAADAVGLALLKSIGTTEDLMNTRIWDHPTIKRGVAVYSPSLSSETIELRSEGIDNIDEIQKQLA